MSSKSLKIITAARRRQFFERFAINCKKKQKNTVSKARGFLTSVFVFSGNQIRCKKAFLCCNGLHKRTFVFFTFFLSSKKPKNPPFFLHKQESEESDFAANCEESDSEFHLQWPFHQEPRPNSVTLNKPKKKKKIPVRYCQQSSGARF